MTTVKKATERDIEMAKRDLQEYRRKRRMKYTPTPVVRICNNCKREYELITFDKRLKERKVIYCSRACYIEWQRKQSPWISNPVEKICEREGCSIAFIINSSADKNKRFCSYSCASLYRAERYKENGGKMGGYRPKGSKI